MSYPRSGNSFLRRYLELITGIFTGSDIHIDLSMSLQMMGLKGEYVVDNSVWISKTHCPSYFPRSLQFTANKMIVIVRSPLDVCYSWVGLAITNSHSLKIKTKLHEERAENWTNFVQAYTNA